MGWVVRSGWVLYEVVPDSSSSPVEVSVVFICCRVFGFVYLYIHFSSYAFEDAGMDGLTAGCGWMDDWLVGWLRLKFRLEKTYLLFYQYACMCG